MSSGWRLHPWEWRELARPAQNVHEDSSAERPKAIAEVARVLKPGGNFLLMIIRVDWKTWLVSPLLAHHPSQNPEPWRALLRESGFDLKEEGTAFTTLYFLATKHEAPRGNIGS